jgi:hypothetical protein
MAGVKFLPFILSCSVCAAASGLIVTKTGGYRLITWLGMAIMTLGFGLMIMLDYDTI